VIDSLQITPEGYGYKAKGFVHQKLRDAPSLFTQNRLPVVFYDSLGRMVSEHTVAVNGEFATFETTMGYKPAWALADPDIRVPGAMTGDRRVIKGTGNTDFAGSYFRLITNVNPDSAVIHVTHYRVAPDPLKTPVDGWVLSDFRFWQVKGHFPAGFDATGRFTYSKTLHLDDSLLVSTADSLMILYRADARSDWQMIDALRQGTSFAGNILVSHLKPGDYTLAVKKFGTGIQNPDTGETGHFRIYPNPSQGVVVIETASQTGLVEVFSADGRRVFGQQTTSASQSVRWQAPAQGPYFVRFTPAGRKSGSFEKVVVVK